jgi:hypothetical protein
VTTDDPNEVRSMLAVAFAERPTPVLDEAIRQTRRRRAISGIQTILSQPRSENRAVVHRIRWGETAAVVALAAGLALVAGRLWPDAVRTSPVAAFRTIESNGQILCDRDDGRNWTNCNPSQAAGVVGLRTLERAAVTLETVAGVRLNLEASSTLLMSNSNASTLASRVTLTEGCVDVKVPKLGLNRQFSVFTPSATITVHGTAFSVEVTKHANQTYRTCVKLRDGAISVLADGREYKLVAPATWGCDASSKAVASTSDVVVEIDDASKDGAERASLEVAHRPNLANLDRSTLALETKLLQRALGAERRKDLASAEKSLKQLLTLYPNSVVAPEARAALERISTQRIDK